MNIYEDDEIIAKVKDLDEAILFCRARNENIKSYNLIEIER